MVNGCKNVVLRSVVACHHGQRRDVVRPEQRPDKGSFCLALAVEGENIGMDYFR